mmetsp:Transcript_24474/g.53219  ORF Transcript_24474/g.53219 Transcript_24474/m.53219 type:complete len:149 (-) Transcript_24474:318-764(-)
MSAGNADSQLKVQMMPDAVQVEDVRAPHIIVSQAGPIVNEPPNLPTLQAATIWSVIGCPCGVCISLYLWNRHKESPHPAEKKWAQYAALSAPVNCLCWCCIGYWCCPGWCCVAAHAPHSNPSTTAVTLSSLSSSSTLKAAANVVSVGF